MLGFLKQFLLLQELEEQRSLSVELQSELRALEADVGIDTGIR